MIFTERHRVGRRSWPPAILLLLLSATLLAGVVSCSGGVSEEEFIAVMKDLETEKTRSQALESELAIEIACAARLVEAVDRFEARVAVLECERAKEKVAIVGRQDRVDEAEAGVALLTAFLAWNRKDREEFVARFTGNGISETSLSMSSSLGEPPIALRRVMDADVTGDTATIHAMFALELRPKSTLT